MIILQAMIVETRLEKLQASKQIKLRSAFPAVWNSFFVLHNSSINVPESMIIWALNNVLLFVISLQQWTTMILRALRL